ncbi:MAG: hypothetical protein ACI835_003034 [Planctomycetota bacterium]|jgi:hypothetical protein
MTGAVVFRTATTLVRKLVHIRINTHARVGIEGAVGVADFSKERIDADLAGRESGCGCVSRICAEDKVVAINQRPAAVLIAG